MFGNVFSKWFDELEGAPKVPPSSASENLRVLVSISGGPNAPSAFGILPGLAGTGCSITLLNVRHPEATRISGVFDPVLAQLSGVPVTCREVLATDPIGAIVEATADADVAIFGASPAPRPISNPKLLSLVSRSRCPTLVVRGRRRTPRTGRDGRRALVVAEGRAARGRTLDRALRWASAGSTSQDLLLGPGHGSFVLPERPIEMPAGTHLRTTELLQSPFEADRVLVAIDEGDHDLLVVAADLDEVARGEEEWIDSIFVSSRRAVVAALGTPQGPRTRHRERLVVASH